MANEKSSNDPAPRQHHDALAALQGLGSGEAHEDEAGAHDNHEPVLEVEEVAEVAEASEPSPSASGFVGMLSKTPQANDDLVPVRPGGPTPQPVRPTPQPSSEIPLAAESPRAPGTEEIRMAREITLPAGGGVARPVGRPGSRVVRKVPGWYHVAVPIMFTISSLLLLIGFWAVAAVIAIMARAESFPLLSHAVDGEGYPLQDEAGRPSFSGMSKAMAFGMLIALPVALCLVAMAVTMKRHMAAAEQAAARKG
jgi:hypothetical protein